MNGTPSTPASFGRVASDGRGEPPNGPRAQAALIVTLVLLVGGFSIIFLLLLRPPTVGALDAQTATALIAAIGGIFAALSLALRYWFPSD